MAVKESHFETEPQGSRGLEIGPWDGSRSPRGRYRGRQSQSMWRRRQVVRFGPQEGWVPGSNERYGCRGTW